MKQIEFSKGETLIDDLVQSDDEIPLFSYDFDEYLRIDLEEIQRIKEIKEWEAEQSKLDNFQCLQYIVQGGDPQEYGFQIQNHFPFSPDGICQEDNHEDENYNEEIQSWEFSNLAEAQAINQQAYNQDEWNMEYIEHPS